MERYKYFTKAFCIYAAESEKKIPGLVYANEIICCTTTTSQLSLSKVVQSTCTCVTKMALNLFED